MGVEPEAVETHPETGDGTPSTSRHLMTDQPMPDELTPHQFGTEQFAADQSPADHLTGGQPAGSADAGGEPHRPAVRPTGPAVPPGSAEGRIPGARQAGDAGGAGWSARVGGARATGEGGGRFTPLVSAWIAAMGGLRGLVRHELVARQLAAHLPERPLRVLDVGCGQGTQLLRLARAGHRVTGLEASGDMLTEARTALAGEPPEVRGRIRLMEGDGLEAGRFFAAHSFDVVCCHGVLPLVDGPDRLLASLARVLAPGGTLSLLARNGDALAMRPGLHERWQDAVAAFDRLSYRDRDGGSGRADTLRSLGTMLQELSVPIRTWYGVRVFTDRDEHDRPPHSPAELEAVLACEEEAGRRDPYRRVAAWLHIIGAKAPRTV